MKQTKRIYYFCQYDSYGQRNGFYNMVELRESSIEISSDGSKYWEGHFLYEDLKQCLAACQD